MRLARLFSRPLKSWVPPTARRSIATVSVEGDAVRVDASTSFPLIWLRDSCQCPHCVHPSTRQKLHRSSDFVPHSLNKASSQQPRARSVEAADGGLRIQWAEDGHVSFFSSDFLRRYSSPSKLESFHRDIRSTPWLASHLAEANPVDYASLSSSPQTLLAVYRALLRDGLVFFRGLPTQKTSDAECELRVLAERLGAIRNTFYGETWDVRNVRNSKNIAYTNLNLGFHMDLLYFKEPPRYQILHALCNRVVGGHSIFVDAFHAAHRLKLSSPKAYDILASTPVPFHYINDGHHLHCSHPTLELSRQYHGKVEEEPRLVAVNYSPPFQAPLPSTTPASFYEALAEYVELLNDPAACVKRLLGEGDAVIFDNRRVLHGRTAFHEHEDSTQSDNDGQTNRWLKGCYLEEDPVLDRHRVLSAREAADELQRTGESRSKP